MKKIKTISALIIFLVFFLLIKLPGEYAVITAGEVEGIICSDRYIDKVSTKRQQDIIEWRLKSSNTSKIIGNNAREIELQHLEYLYNYIRLYCKNIWLFDGTLRTLRH